jgi:tetratricopeptide (TPR) repeat protein
VNNQRAYTSAEALLNEGNYEEAIEAFTALGDYKDSVQRIAETNELLNEATERELAAQYAEAETLLDAGKYDDAVEAFEALGDYSDAKNMVIYCRNEQLYSEITELLSNGNTANAYLLLQELGEYKDSTEMMENLVFENPYLEYLAVQERETVFFGAYEQDNDTSNGAEPVEWIVLKKRENQLMLLSKYCLDAQPFDTTDANYMVWQNSELYDWLNTEFLEAAFSEDERNMIMDKITLLGVDDTETYIDQIGTLSAEATSYAIAQGADTRDGNAYWWLKTFFDPFTGNYGTYGSSAAYVTPSGTVSSTALDISDISIRPVVWIEIT